MTTFSQHVLSAPITGSFTCWMQRAHRPYHYHPPAKLWGGNIFSHVCLLFCPQGWGIQYDHHPWRIGPHLTGTPWPCAPYPAPTPRHGTWLQYTLTPSPSIRQTCSNLFNLDLTVQWPHTQALYPAYTPIDMFNISRVVQNVQIILAKCRNSADEGTGGSITHVRSGTTKESKRPE